MIPSHKNRQERTIKRGKKKAASLTQISLHKIPLDFARLNQLDENPVEPLIENIDELFVSQLHLKQHVYLDKAFPLIDQKQHAHGALVLMNCMKFNEAQKKKKFQDFGVFELYPSQKEQEAWNDSQIKRRQQVRTYLGKDFVAKKSFAIIQIRPDPINQDMVIVVIKGGQGEIVFTFTGFQLKNEHRKINKKIQTNFKEKCIFFIINQTLGHLMDILYLDSIVKKGNQFVYIHKGLEMFKDQNQLDHNKIYVLDRTFTKSDKQENQIIVQARKMYLFQKDSDSFIVSELGLQYYLNGLLPKFFNKIDQYTNYQNQIMSLIELKYIPNHIFLIYVKFVILNLTYIYKKNKINKGVKEATMQIIEFELRKTKQCKAKKLQDLQINIQNHYPQKMQNCKLCKVCNKKHQEKLKEMMKKKKYRDSKYDQQRSNEDKIKKTKYKCEGCSIKTGIQVSLCVVCFKQFHTKVKYYLDQQINTPKKPKIKQQASSSEQINSQEASSKNQFQKSGQIQKIDLKHEQKAHNKHPAVKVQEQLIMYQTRVPIEYHYQRRLGIEETIAHMEQLIQKNLYRNQEMAQLMQKLNKSTKIDQFSIK